MIAEFLQSQKSAHDGKRKAARDAEGDESKTKKKKDDVSPDSLFWPSYPSFHQVKGLSGFCSASLFVTAITPKHIDIIVRIIHWLKTNLAKTVELYLVMMSCMISAALSVSSSIKKKCKHRKKLML